MTATENNKTATLMLPRMTTPARGTLTARIAGAFPAGGARSPAQLPLSRPEQDARIMTELLVPAALHGLARLDQVEPLGAKRYLDQFVADAISQEDPVEKILLEQLLLIHVRLTRLHEQAAGQDSSDGIKIVNAAAARLIGEFRRLVLALKTYRAPVTSKSVTFVKMQAVAEKQEVQYVDNGGNSDERIVSSRNELEDTQPDGFGGRFTTQQEPSLRSRREEASTVDG